MERSKLSDHVFKKGKFITPINAIPMMQELPDEKSWTYGRMPEYLWIGLILKKYGRSVVQIDNEVTSLPIEEVAHKSNFVPRDNNLIKAGRTMGISFGDELL